MDDIDFGLDDTVSIVVIQILFRFALPTVKVYGIHDSLSESSNSNSWAMGEEIESHRSDNRAAKYLERRRQRRIYRTWVVERELDSSQSKGETSRRKIKKTPSLNVLRKWGFFTVNEKYPLFGSSENGDFNGERK